MLLVLLTPATAGTGELLVDDAAEVVSSDVEDRVRGRSSRVGEEGRGTRREGGEECIEVGASRGFSERVRRRGTPRGMREGDGEGVRARSSDARGGKESGTRCESKSTKRVSSCFAKGLSSFLGRSHAIVTLLTLSFVPLRDLLPSLLRKVLAFPLPTFTLAQEIC